MWSLGKLVPYLLAAPSATKWEPKTPHDLSAAFQQLYVDLEKPGLRNKEITESLRFSYVTPPAEDGTTTWTSIAEPRLEHQSEEDSSKEKPVALFLPGLDGYGISAARNQFDDLASVFDFWRMTVLPQDRSSFMDIVNNVTLFVEELSESSTRKVVLVGESCGGALALAVAIKLAKRGSRDVLQGLVVCNPATSFDKTAWELLVPLLTYLPSNSDKNSSPFSDEAGAELNKTSVSTYAVLGSLILSSLVPDNGQKLKIASLIMDLPSMEIPPRDAEQIQEIWEATADSFRGMEDRLPPGTLEHRVSQWLGVGTSIVNSRLSEIKDVPTLIVVGDEDSLMPSKDEGPRLEKALSKAGVLKVKQRGHFVLDDTVNLTEAILYSEVGRSIMAEKPKYDPILDWKLPSKDEIDDAIETTVKPLERLVSPVYFSTDSNGKRWRGLGKIPEKKGPLLFVANHQTLGVDMRFIFSRMLEETGIFPRGLAHPIVYAAQNASELLGRTPGLKQRGGTGPGGTMDFQEFGAVMVSPKNYYRMMQTNQTAMLFPGGAREALSGDRTYPLHWPTGKADFVRTAARFNATVVPLSAVGMADCFNTVVKYEDLERLPFIGKRVRNFTSSQSGARYDQKNQSDFLADILAPSMPARNYILFGRAVDLTSVDPKDIDECSRIYKQLYGDVRSGIDQLLSAREKDPFRDTPRRIAYEQVFKKQAPTFPVDECLNR